MRPSLIFLVSLALALTLAPVRQGEAAGWNLVILSSSDTEGQLDPFKVKAVQNGDVAMEEVGGFARLSWSISRAKDKFPGMVLTLSSGEDLMGPSFTRLQGMPIYELMNFMGYDAGCFGNHEFDQGDAYLAKSLEYRDFPVVEANLTVAPGSPLEGKFLPWTLIERNGLKIGVFGLMLSDLALISQPGPNVAVDPDYIGAAAKAIDALKAQGADVIVALAHIGLNHALTLAAKLPDIDVVCVGNSADLVEKGGELVRHPDNSMTIVTQSGQRGEYLGMLKLEIEDGLIRKYHWNPIRMDSSIPKDPKVEALMEQYRARLPANALVANTDLPIDTRKKTLRTGEAAMGDFVCDIIRERFNTDVALYNGGGIRGDKILEPGPLTSFDLDEMFPFRDRVALVPMTGKILKQCLERGVAEYPVPAGEFLQVSGVRFKIDPTAEPLELALSATGEPTGVASPGSRVFEVEVAGPDGSYAPLDEARTYTVGTSMFLAQGGDGYVWLRNIPGVRDTDTLVRTLVENELVSRNRISLTTSGRIKLAH